MLTKNKKLLLIIISFILLLILIIVSVCLSTNATINLIKNHYRIAENIIGNKVPEGFYPIHANEEPNKRSIFKQKDSSVLFFDLKNNFISVVNEAPIIDLEKFTKCRKENEDLSAEEFIKLTITDNLEKYLLEESNFIEASSFELYKSIKCSIKLSIIGLSNVETKDYENIKLIDTIKLNGKKHNLYQIEKDNENCIFFFSNSTSKALFAGYCGPKKGFDKKIGLNFFNHINP